jgi:hypothetical protein
MNKITFPLFFKIPLYFFCLIKNIIKNSFVFNLLSYIIKRIKVVLSVIRIFFLQSINFLQNIERPQNYSFRKKVDLIMVEIKYKILKLSKARLVTWNRNIYPIFKWCIFSFSLCRSSR